MENAVLETAAVAALSAEMQDAYRYWERRAELQLLEKLLDYCEQAEEVHEDVVRPVDYTLESDLSNDCSEE